VLVYTEGSYDLEEEGQGEFDSFVEPAGLILSSFIRKYLILHPGEGMESRWWWGLGQRHMRQD
jgi:hypothetical protein